MRPLCFGDTFKIARIGKKVGVEKLAKMYSDAVDSVKDITDEAEKKRIINDKAMDYIGVLLAGYDNCEAEVVDLMASVSAMTPDEINGMSFEALEQWIADFASLNDSKQVIGFFTKALGSMR